MTNNQRGQKISKRRTTIKTINLKQLLKIVGLIALVLYLSVTLAEQQRQINDNRQRTQEVMAQIEAANLQTAILEEELAQVGTDEHIKRVARENLRLALPGDIIIVDAGRAR